MDRIAIQQPDLPSLRFWLQERSVAERRTLARLWRLEASEAGLGAEALLQSFLTPEGVATLLAQLRPGDRAALERLQAEGGTIQSRIFEREFGTVRDHGAYPNPRAYLDALASPPSATERLYTLGLIQRCRTATGAIYAIPAELVQLLPAVPPRDRRLHLQAAEAEEVSAGDPAQIERELVALLTAAYHEPLAVGRNGELRRPARAEPLAYLTGALLPSGLPAGTTFSERALPRLGLLRHLALELGLLRRTRAGLRPTAEALVWLERAPFERRQELLEAWLRCGWDELTALCGLQWRAEPLRRDQAASRQALLQLLAQAPAGTWFSLDQWVAEVRRVEPDFQRPDGIYDTWMLVDEAQQSRVGFHHWNVVEGRLARAVIEGPLAWLGLVDLGRLAGVAGRAARLNHWGLALLQGAVPPPVEEQRLVVEADFSIFVPPQVPLLARFQLSRFAEREAHGSFEMYRLTRERLYQALDRGIPIQEMLAFLERFSAESLPQNVRYTLGEWAEARQALRLRPALLLEADDPLLLEQIRRDRKLALPPLEALGERYWALAEGDGRSLAEALRRAGYGVVAELPAYQEPLSEHDLAALVSCAEALAQLAEQAGLAGAPSAALRRRLERRLSSTRRSQARRAAAELVRRLKEIYQDLEKENEL